MHLTVSIGDSYEADRKPIVTSRERIMNNPLSAVDYWVSEISRDSRYNPDVECLATLALDSSLCVIRHVVISVGALNHVFFNSHEVFRFAIREGACALLIMHNHPSGNVLPSESDRATTNQLVQSAKILRIRLKDHVIIAEDEYFSFHENDLLQT